MNLLQEYGSVVSALVLVAVSLLVGVMVRHTLLARLERLAKKRSAMDDVLVGSLKRPLPLWFGLAGLYVASSIAPIPGAVAPLLRKALLSLLILSATLWAAKLVTVLLQRRESEGGVVAPAAGVVRNVARISVLAVGGLVLLGTLGISVAPVLTTVGIGGLAVALGLQETLSNLFAGIQITFAGNIRIGDFIRLESGEEGYVDDIQWRTTRVRTLPNNFVLIPNSRLAQSVVTNYHRPSTELSVLIEVGVHYSSDLERVEALTREVARSVLQRVQGGVADFEPLIRFHTFADSSINLTAVLRVREFTAQFVVKHEFIKALASAYAAEGIVIPFPIRALNLEQEGVRLPLPGP